MHLHERLMDLLGHRISVATQMNGEVKEIAVGELKETGPDFLILVTKRHEGAKQAETGTDWWIRLAMVVAIVHMSNCARCANTDTQDVR